MGSVGIQNSNPNPTQNQNPFAPYDNYRDCSQGICSIYCPQYCYLVFPPPPPSSDDDSGPPFSPLVIAIVVVLVCAFILASYYTFATRLRNDRAVNAEAAAGEEIRGEESSQDPWGNPPTGLDEALIKRITVCKYQKGDGLIEGTDCAVCLCEFRENESLRLMPKCSHAFHLPCIDTWLKSQSNCPLCRANVVASTPPPLPSSILHMNSSERQRPDDSVITVTMHDQERNNCDHDEQMVVVGAEESVETGLPPSTAGAVLPHRHLLISDILKFEEIDEYIKVENDHLWRGTGSSSGRGGELLRSPVASKKMSPGGGFLFGVQDRGKNSVG